MTVKFIEKEYAIPDDLLIYIDLLDLTNDIRMTLNKKFYELLKNEEAGCIDDNQLIPEINNQIGRFISKLLDNNIYDRTVNDYLKGNKGFELISKVNSTALAKLKEFFIDELNEYREGVEDALYKKDSSITGMGFSIWSGSFVNHAIYAAMQASTISKQETEANAIYQREITNLQNSITSKYSGAQRQYIYSTYIPNMESAIAVFSFELLDTYISDLIEYGKMSKEILNYINIDRSNDLLKNLVLSSNKQEILYKAFETCPYNIKVYTETLNCGFMNYETFETAQYFKQDKQVLLYLTENLGEVEYPSKFKINYIAVEKLAEFTKRDVFSLLQAKTEAYVASVIKAYSRVANMLNKKDVANKVMKQCSELDIFSGDIISKHKAKEYVDEIVPEKVWHELVEKCGYVDLFDRIKTQVLGADSAICKSDIDMFLKNGLFDLFEEARLEILNQITVNKNLEQQKKEEQERIQRERKNKIKKITKIIVPIIITLALLVFGFIVLLNSVIIPNTQYNNAINLMNQGKYEKAISEFENLKGYKDSESKIEECQEAIVNQKYEEAKSLMVEGNYEEAIKVFLTLKGYKDSKSKISECNTAILNLKYNSAVELMNDGKYEEAISAFELLGDYRDSVALITTCQNIIFANKYENAIALINQGKYKQAIEIFKTIKDYKDSVELIKKCSFLGCEKGDIILFGSYEQDGDLTNGVEEIEWIVLNRTGNKALVISKYCLAQKPFNETLASVTWENCTIRSWLNNNFLSIAFNQEEKDHIISSTIEDEGTYTTDRIFLLSEEEANVYFDSNYDRKSFATDYVYTNHCYWLLRTTGTVSNVAYVSYDGEVGYYENVDRDWWIRPEMWIEIAE